MVCAPFFVATNAPVSQANFNVDMRSLIIPAASIALNASPLPVASTSVTLDGV